MSAILSSENVRKWMAEKLRIGLDFEDIEVAWEKWSEVDRNTERLSEFVMRESNDFAVFFYKKEEKIEYQRLKEKSAEAAEPSVAKASDPAEDVPSDEANAERSEEIPTANENDEAGEKEAGEKDGEAEGEESAKPEDAPTAEEEAEDNVKAAEEELLPVAAPPQPEYITEVVTRAQLLVSYNDLPSDEDGGTAYCYFLKSSDSPPAAESESGELDFGIIQADLLVSLKPILSEVYLSAFRNIGKEPSLPGQENASAAQKLPESAKNEFISNTSKFTHHVASLIIHTDAGLRLNIPDVDVSRDDSDNFEVFNLVESSVEDWAEQIGNIVEAQGKMRMTGQTPVAEIEFWRERFTALSQVTEQLQTPKVGRMLDLLEYVDSQAIPVFRIQEGELNKLHLEAKDNVKFLSTLERHFKNISTGSLLTIIDTIPSMMNALRMVWIISRHYNTDERMVPLMSLIARDLSTRVGESVTVQSLELPSSEAISKIEEGAAVLRKWKESYLQVREKIEMSARDQRWEFDRTKLFGRTDYQLERLQEMLEVAKVMQQFRNILGPELKAVTGDSHAIDAVLDRVDSLSMPFVDAPFDVFDKRYHTSWATIMARFNSDVADIEKTTIEFIDGSFSKLRSAEGAFDLMMDFRNIQTRSSIMELMNKKFDNVLDQFAKELEEIYQIFAAKKDAPPLNKGSPPIAGSIAWSRSLFQRLKKSVLKFQNNSTILTSASGKNVSARYIEIGREMRDYERSKYVTWKENAEQGIMPVLKMTVLKEAVFEGKDAAVEATAGDAPGEQTDRKKKSHMHYQVNMPQELLDIIRETKYLDRLGFDIPELPMNVTLQESKFLDYCEILQGICERYDSIVCNLEKQEQQLLSAKIEVLRTEMSPGVRYINWSSLSIPEYARNCDKRLSEFQAFVNAVTKNSSVIDASVKNISRALLFDNSIESGSDGSEVQEFFDKCEKHRQSVVEELVVKYASIGPLLTKIEEVVVGTSTGRAAVMSEYYRVWEKRVFKALSQMIINSMYAFIKNILRRSRKDGDANNSKKGVLFRVVVSLSAPDVVISPTYQDVQKLVSGLLTSFVESSKSFVRWMRHSCIETPGQEVSDADEPFFFNFYSDVRNNPQVIKLVIMANQLLQKTFSDINKHLEGWRKFTSLWKLDKATVLESFHKRGPSLQEYEARLLSYSRIASEVDTQIKMRQIGPFLLSMAPLAAALRTEATAWVHEIGAYLHRQAKKELDSMVEETENLAVSLKRSPDSLEDLKFVLKVIADINDMNPDMELRYYSMIEQYRVLITFDLETPPAEQASAFNAFNAWENLMQVSREVDFSLLAAKVKFKAVTEMQVAEFSDVVSSKFGAFKSAGPGAPDISLEAGSEMLARYQEILEGMQKQRDDIVLAQRLFNIPMQPFPEMQAAEKDMRTLETIFKFYNDIQAQIQAWSKGLWADLRIQSLTAGVDQFFLQLKKLPKDCQGLPPYRKLEELLNNFKDSLPLITDLKSPAMRDRHWKQLMQVTEQTFEMNPKTFTLENIFSMNLHEFSAQISDIVNFAQKELSIEKGLSDIEEVWRDMKFVVSKLSSGAGGDDKGFVLAGTDDITQALEDNAMNLQSMASSRFIGHFKEAVETWEKNLSLISEVTEVWMQVQRKWMYLEGIFIGSDDIRLQLPEEARKFDVIDKSFKKLMNETAKNTNVLQACSASGRLDMLTSMQSQLEQCQKSLSDYLQTKRVAFARFFFISDDELLSILGSPDPNAVQEHMLKLFDNTAALVWGQGRLSRSVCRLESSEKESIDFVTPVPAEGNVETWMSNVEKEMRVSLRRMLKESTFYYPSEERIPWFGKYSAMIGATASQIYWTWEVEDVFRKVKEGGKRAMKEYLLKLTSQLNEMVSEVKKPLNSLDRKKINTNIIIDVHARDIVDRFVRDSILDAREFAWESQLRFYWDKSVDDCLIRQCTGEFMYGYEYLGASGRLVITPLTDRCYMTITTAMAFKLGGAPAGPAGTGKTETVKDLAKAMGCFCVVFNCGEGLDYKAMGSIFTGLVQTGSWGCFDEFNRIDVEVLSVVSAQIKTIQNALMNNLEKFQFEGREVNCNPRCGIFITMNPGYAGRTELPDNLKALFRPVVMVVPDLLLICEIMLFSEGFVTAKVLAKKMTVLYKLAKEQLSKQYHYDFGLRALKSVLVMAGALKRGSPDLSEEIVLMRALRDMNMPKFVYEDVPLFRGLISDLFPGLDCPRVRYASFNDAVEGQLKENGYQVLEIQVDKVIQLYETMLTRHTTMVVGPTGGGKSVVIETLCRAQTQLGVPTKTYIINPKAQPVQQLYGVLDPVTRDWTDGLLSSIFRDINQPTEKNDRKYIIYDGDVDALWVENMNSVMDDNKLLTLPNGERIRLLPTCAMLYEVFDLQYASPATISRCGMVYLDPKDLAFEPFVWKWCNEQRTAIQEPLRKLSEKYLKKVIEYATEGLVDGLIIDDRVRTSVPHSDLNMARQLCRMLTAILAPLDPPLEDANVLEAVFVFCIVWSVGAALVSQDRGKFDQFLKKTSGMNVMDGGCGCGSLPGKSSTLFEYVFDIESRQWKSFEDLVEDYTPPADGKFSSILVPTLDTVRSAYLMNIVFSYKLPLLFIGESGTAKTVTIQDELNKKDPSVISVLNVNFSSRTSSLDVQRTLEDNVDKRTKDTFGPTGGKTMVVFVDDLSMPKIDTYGTQQPIALLKLLIERGYMYDREELYLKNLRDIQFIGAMPPPGGGRNAVDPRFISLFCIFNISSPSDVSLSKIFSSILSSHVHSFSDAIKGVAEKLTALTLELYNRIVVQLPPTPAKFHYIFNLRDLSRIYEGLCLATQDHFTKAVDLVRLWRNESMRIFFDRLIDDGDRKFVRGTLDELIAKTFPSEKEEACQDPALYGDYKGVVDGGEVRLYEHLGDYSVVKPILTSVLEEHNMTKKPMKLVLFENAIEHLNRIHRILRLPRGNALLVGVGGSGKQSLTRLATYLAGYETFEITLSRGYGETEFREDIKTLYTKLGVDNKPMVFIFTDAHVVQEGFLELINNLLTSGVVPALYAEDEKDSMAQVMRDEVIRAGKPDTKEMLWKAFINRCRDNLHVVLAMSPAGDTLRQRCRNFPGLVNCCVIDWFIPWPEEALRAVATVFLSDVELPEDTRGTIIDHMVMVHLSATTTAAEYCQRFRRFLYITPKNYLDYIENYRKLLAESRKTNGDLIKRFGGGLDKLIQAAEEVDVMSANLAEQKKVVEQKTKDCEELLETIATNTTVAEAKQKEAEVSKGELKIMNKKIGKEKAEAEEELAKAIPALEAAKAALENLSKSDITELKSFAKPHPLVEAVTAAVCCLKGVKDTSWKGAKAMMASTSFLNELIEFDKDNIKEKEIKPVKTALKNPQLQVENMLSISAAAAGLLVWVVAVNGYYDVAKMVNPKRQAVAQAEKSLRTSEKELKKTEDEIASLTKQLKDLGDQYNKANLELKDLSEKAALMSKRLDAASRLISGLQTERERWGLEMEHLQSSRVQLDADCLLCSAFLSYTGSFSFEYRQQLVQERWFGDCVERKLPVSQPFRLEKLLTDEVEVARWASESLPSDELSVQNGMLMTRANRWPLCVDPQMQAVNWIKKKEAKNSLKVCTFNDPDFLKHLELAIQYGFSFLFEGIDEFIDPIIDPLLEKNIVVQGNRRLIKLGDKELDYDPSFQLFFTTKLANPHYTPEISGKSMIINFTVTLDGLQAQLLNVTVEHERPDLEEQRKKLIAEMSENKALLKKLEDSLLRELADSTGLILDNEDLIRTLEQTKVKAGEISQKLELATTTSAKINEVRESYTDAAKRGAILFFVLAGLSYISSMYEYSLSAYLGVYHQALDKADRNAQLSIRLKHIMNTLTYMVYNYTCTGIFETHKLMFSFQMTIKILEGEGKLDSQYLDFLLKGNISLERSERKNPFPAWLPDQGWEDIIRLQSIGDKFQSLPDDIAGNGSKWKEWYDLEAPEAHPLPGEYDEKLDVMEKLLILRCFRIDRVYLGIERFVIHYMGEKYVQPPVLNYKNIFEQSTAISPVVFVLSPGADPLMDVMKLAEEEGFGGNKFRFIALGQGQGPVAANLLETGKARGLWIMLQNCHLLASWLKTLDKLIEKLEGAHKDFRLWLTTDPTPKFPLGILQKSLKVVTEPPNGLKLNLRSSYSRITEETLQMCPHDSFRPIVFVLAFFHAVVQERRKYGRIGWNVAYDFNESDFRVSMLLLNTYLTKAHVNNDPQIPWGSLRYLVGEAMYGGRVTDDYDRRAMMTYLEEYMGDFLFDTFQPFHFYCNEEVDYHVPHNGPQEDYAAAIETLPLTQTPMVFGLHPNAEIGYLSDATREVFASLISMLPRVGGSTGGMSREEYIGNVASDIVSKLPVLFDIPKIAKGFGVPSPTQIVLLQELERWNGLVRRMGQNVKDLQRALVGEIGMSPELDDLATAFFSGAFPHQWRRLAPMTQKSLGNWMIHFERRYAQYNDWVSKGEPKVIWLSGLHIPESYLTALVQTTCREKKWPLDKSTLYTEVTRMKSREEVKEKPKAGCFVEGLYLEGAAWDHENSCLRRQDPKQLVTELPILQVIPIEARKLKLQGTFNTPVYVTQERRNAMGVGLVFEANLRSVAHDSLWCLQGVCLTLNVV